MAVVTGAVIAAGGLALGVYGAIKNDEARGKAEQAIQEAVSEIKKVGAPPQLAQQIVIDKLKSVGVYTPEVEQALQVDFSNVEKLATESKALQAQKDALSQFQQRANTGLNAEDRAAFSDVRKQVARDAKGRRDAVLQNFASRGQGGSGAELLAALSSGQEADAQQAEAGDRISAEASRRALQALESGSALATTMYNQDENRARAMDELNRFNVTNQIDRTRRNVDRVNDANRRNLDEKQRIADTNVQLGNQERMARIAQQQADYQAKLGYAKDIANAKTGQAAQVTQAGASQSQDIANIAQGAIGLGGSIYDKYQKNKEMDLKYGKK